MHLEDHVLLGHLRGTISIPPPFLSVHVALLSFLFSILKPLSTLFFSVQVVLFNRDALFKVYYPIFRSL